jgi:hypothetical protein
MTYAKQQLTMRSLKLRVTMKTVQQTTEFARSTPTVPNAADLYGAAVLHSELRIRIA